MVRKSVSHRTEDVLMLFRYTGKPPENPIFPPAALRVSAVAFAYTENSSFPFFNREPDVKLSVRRCRVQGSFRGRDVPAT